MSTNVPKTLEERLQRIDVTKLVEYSRKIEDIARLNHMLAPLDRDWETLLTI